MAEILGNTNTVKASTANFEPLGNDLFKLTLSEENKGEIFEYALSKLDQSQQEATAILHNVTKWDPSAAALFASRSASTILSTPFRLIFPNSALRWFDETGLYVRQYTAISYCWRSEEFLPEGYERYGDWPVCKPFVDAILEDKEHPRQGIWMDQPCIDQASIVDKQMSVAAMDVIYRSCIRLLILLEDVCLDEPEVALCEKYDLVRGTRRPATWLPEPEERNLFTRFYGKVNKARWWDRAWCLHEFSVNEPWSDKRQCNEIHNATFIVNGPKGSTVKIKWYTLHFIMATALQSDLHLASTVVTGFKGQAIFSAVDIGDREPGWRASLMARYNGISRKSCLHLGDKMSVMINMCGLGLSYHGHALASNDELLYLNVLIAMAAGEACPLTMFCGDEMVTLFGRPTWLQRHVAADDTSIPRFKLGSLNGIHRISAQEIDLDVVFLPKLAWWNRVEENDLEITYDIFPDTITTTEFATDNPKARSYWANRGPDAELDVCRRRFLAACILNGYNFTARLWAQLQNDVVRLNYNQGWFKDLAANPDLLREARHLMDCLLPVTSLLCISPPPEFTLADAHLFLTWLTDPRSMYYISVFSYRVQCTSDNQKAIITAVHTNEQFINGPFKELAAAVPTDLVSQSCMRLRVWILRPVKTPGVEDGKWQLVGKGLLLGEPDLMCTAEKAVGGRDDFVQLRRVVVGG